MAEQAPMETVARTIAAFRSTNPNGKLEQDYQVIFRQAIRQLFQRLLTHRRRTLSSPTIRTPNEASQTGAAIANKMARVFLPALREKLRQLPAAMHPSSMRSGSSTWFEAILDNLIEIDKLLAEIDSSIITIWRTWNPRQGQERTAHQLSSYRGKMDTYRIEELLAGPICQLLIVCGKFFIDFSFSSPSSENHIITQRWNTVSTRTNTSIVNLDRLIRYLQKPLTAAALHECQDLLAKIDKYIKLLYKHMNPTFHTPSEDVESGYESDEYIEELSATGKKYVRNGIPVIKLCRVFFNKLSRSTNSQPLIFFGPGMKMDDDRVKDVLVHTEEAKRLIYEFTDEVTYSPSHRQNSETVSINIQGALIDCWGDVEDYWKSLLASNDPRVDQEAIADARQWLDSFKSAWFSATTKMMMAAGWQCPGSNDHDEPDTDEDGGGLYFGGYETEEEDYDDEEEDENVDEEDSDDEDDESVDEDDADKK
ncbi:hypothetical protein Pst134EA_015796 [Puccinia striiformis f. sp. tritici]|uniref:hypothetical protein n=1 Tax=Puccinia striiformis f. sp. tritici TaxID=168172 RepID=UPI002008AAD2|nr:hypothetical protein Pst134EA_015796 [Puccinia striiformis f. sp. tritici]KAH9463710.1 hypothetical protein Pst134EA_015796 [Puccinia striiformis f. sp. tritici]